MSKPRNMHNSYGHPQSRPSMEDALHQAGVDTSNYLSLRINKADIPDNAELVIQFRDKNTGKLVAVNLNDDENQLFGKNSQFYGKIMEDGHVFNPYIHRRFIASQFRSLIGSYGLLGLYVGASKAYNWQYAIEQIRSECHKLALLARRDQKAFNERSRFFTLPAIASVLDSYVTEIHRTIDSSRPQHGNKDYCYIFGFGRVECRNIRPIKHRFDCLRTAAHACNSYAEMDKLLSEFDFADLPRKLILPRSFLMPFLNAGAYFTMKHAIMFEGKRIHGMDQKHSLDFLYSTADSKEPYACMNLYINAGF